MAASAADGIVRVWYLSTGDLGTVRIWSLPDQRQLAQVRVDASLHCAAFDTATGGILTGSAAGATMVRVNLNQTAEPAR